MHQFDEGHPAFNGFSPFYFQVIGPRLRQEDTARKKGLIKALWVTPLAVLAAALWIYYSFYFELDWTYITMVALGGFSFALSVPSMMLYKVWESTKYSLIGGFCRFKRWSYWKDTPLHGTMWGFKDLQLIPAYESSSYECHISGEAHGANFEFVRVELSKANLVKNDPYPFKSTFKGQLISIEFERNFLGQTIVFPDKGIFNKKSKGGMKRVRLVDPVFEKMFEVYGTDQIESRYLLSPDFMHRLVELEHAFKGKSIRFGFIENRLHIAIKTRMRLGAGSMFRPLDEPERMQNVITALATIYDVIDGVTKPLEPISINPYASQI